ncbi:MULTISPECIES: hypothetical protein [Mannheimia]|uniref:Uncharacterized protein n=1 Tax=Mannheimia pernigra TaxID=111844 RepID=A0A7H8UW04_9PAST|nr:MULTISPECIES: hypothetical protein [Mannheimia]QLB40576.1 hypothetical protein HV559_06680 [Mannheimia pernigra]QLB42574.1 hypothetical protein HV560_06975 [Mannheimia pernigra]QLB44550.1 hypothetical protein HV561_07265 [Mannheimia pernigra]QTM00196.1 hypothetical protein GM698_00465 [Mannheimia sp. ZY171111]
MCTLMQKDVLIEMVATAQADLSKRLALPLNEDQITLSRLRGEIYRSEPAHINFEQMVAKIQNISQKYQHLPQM